MFVKTWLGTQYETVQNSRNTLEACEAVFIAGETALVTSKCEYLITKTSKVPVFGHGSGLRMFEEINKGDSDLEKKSQLLVLPSPLAIIRACHTDAFRLEDVTSHLLAVEFPSIVSYMSRAPRCIKNSA